MQACSLCATPLAAGAPSCPRCGIAAPRRAPVRPPPARRFFAALSMLSVAVVLALPLVHELGGSGCEPRSWVDWHVAMKSACLTPAYVCENMTAAKMLEDPQLAEAYAGALRAGEAAELDALVGHLRAAYGCEGAPSTGNVGQGEPAPESPRLPPGHPPVGRGPHAPQAPIFQAPEVLTI
jgi:hypothetical protein